MTIAEQIYTLVKTLPPEQASEILTFAEYIGRNRERTVQPIETEEQQAPWAEFIHSLAGSWVDDFPDLDTLRSGMGQDIARESL